MLVQCTFVGIGSFWKLNWQPMCDLGRLPHNILAAILPASDAGLYTKVHLLFRTLFCFPYHIIAQPPKITNE